MGYIEKNLVPGETVVYKTHLSWIVLIRPALAALLLAAIGAAIVYEALVPGISPPWHTAMIVAGAVLLVAAIVRFMAGVVRKNSTEVAVTNRRVLIKIGVAARRSVEVLLSKVESINVEESMMGRTLGYGSVIIRGTGGTFETFETIARPNEFRQKVQQQIGSAAAQ
ncbi:MAG: PH domain-containing protein [Candidatus Acidiferrales bacterium]